MTGECKNCAYFEGNSQECKVCIRNPSIVSKQFEPTEVLGMLIEEPIDMFISKEHYSLLRKTLLRLLQKELMRTRSLRYPFGSGYCRDWIKRMMGKKWVRHY